MNDSAKTTTERDIGDLKVRVTPMGVMRRAKMLPRLGGVISAALAKAEGIDLQQDITALAPALQALCDKLDEQQVETLLHGLFVNVSVSHPDRGNISLENDKKIEQAFDGDLMLLFEVAALSLEVNFGNFIERAKGALLGKFAGKLKARTDAAAQSSSSQTS